MLLTDFDIRQALIQKLNMENTGNDYKIIEEFVICDGEARADIATVNGIMKGFEIKSDVDSLVRLTKQIEKYDATFDKCTIVVGKKYKEKIEEKVPEHWGIIFAYRNRLGGVSLKNIRSASFNKNVTERALLDLIWSNEIKSFLKKNEIRGYSNKNKFQLVELIEKNFSLPAVKSFARETLKNRQDWRVV
ncbi:TPA: sce7726 family protein [Enterococcus faecium]|uniref:sce7726 family protein n=1 Tax=Enterococcus hirae TaxID=1354 RepID=UPI0010E80454|nr:sce7726 family protein [Enterococcus hirae]NTM32980.1 sce7726 family protein [Enterococcus faecium]VTS89035.1 Uncharacterised protein [Enterococcus hirae]